MSFCGRTYFEKYCKTRKKFSMEFFEDLLGTCTSMKQQWDRNMCTLFAISGYLPSVKPVLEFCINCTFKRNRNSSYLCFRLHVIFKPKTRLHLLRIGRKRNWKRNSRKFRQNHEISRNWMSGKFRKILSSVEIGQREECSKRLLRQFQPCSVTLNTSLRRPPLHVASQTINLVEIGLTKGIELS